MPQIFEKIKKFSQKIKFRFISSPLPTGQAEFEAFFLSIVQTYDFPENDSFRRMMAVMIQHMPNNVARIKKHHFFVAIKRAMANEVAFYVLKDLNDKAKKQSDEATTVQ